MRTLLLATTFLLLALRASCAVNKDTAETIKELLPYINFDYDLRSSRGLVTDYLTFCQTKFSELCLNLLFFVGSIPNLDIPSNRFKLVKWLREPGEIAKKESSVCILRGNLTKRDRRLTLPIFAPPNDVLILVHVLQEGALLASPDLYCGMCVMPNATLLSDKIKAYKNKVMFLRGNTRPTSEQPMPFQHHSDGEDAALEMLNSAVEHHQKIRLLHLPIGLATSVTITAHQSLRLFNRFLSDRFESGTVSSRVYIAHLVGGVKQLFHNSRVELLQDVTEGGTKLVAKLLISRHFFVKGQRLLRFSDGTIYRAKDSGYVSGPIHDLFLDVLDAPVYDLPFIIYITPD
jgi:hypothetical protein